jgi:hypothetical protein
MKRRKRSENHHRQGDPLKSIFSVNSVVSPQISRDRLIESESQGSRSKHTDEKLKAFSIRKKDKKKKKRVTKNTGDGE